MRKKLQGPKLNYPTIEKHAYVVYKAVKHFESYILKNHTKIIVPHPVVRSLFTQHEMGERRGDQMTVIQEFDLVIKTTKIVRVHGLCKLATKSQDLAGKDEFGWDNKLSLWCNEVLYILPSHDSWYSNLSYFLHCGTCPGHLNLRERRALRSKSSQYCLINSLLFQNNYDEVLLRCLEKEDGNKVLKRYMMD